MVDNYKIGNNITLLRKEKGLTGEKLAELLGVSGQAVSKWENGKNLPETALLPELAKILGVSVDTLLVPQELMILNAVYSDGQTHIDVTQEIGKYVNGNCLNIMVSSQYIGVNIDTDRVCVLTVKYQTPDGIFYVYAIQNANLTLDLNTKGFTADRSFKIIGAYYGAVSSYRDCMDKVEHYAYFKWNEIPGGAFPSRPDVDETEFLTLIYLNDESIHVISCKENEILAYNDGHTSLYVKDTSTFILPGVITLGLEGMTCTWIGAIYAALKYMGEPYTYEQIYGMSGACYRVGFCGVWDWSATDALRGYSYDMPLYDAIGYEPVWANKLDKDKRSAERKHIVTDIQQGKPVVAIHLHGAPEWGVITGYSENGKTLYCRTYYDENGHMIDNPNENHEYTIVDNWPFLITHFGERKEKPSELEVLKASLCAFTESFENRVDENADFFEGAQGYEKWIDGLKNDALWDEHSSDDDTARRFDVNLWTMFHLVDARRCAAVYLTENIRLFTGEKADLLAEMAESYKNISEKMRIIKDDILNKNLGDSWRVKQIEFLEWVLNTEKALVQQARTLIV
ncbi:MAG: helix-turn-helix domain-containing protein [Oscillospiraceae bacterium]|nr:helix-turn-helix domain-containing protein [Oscillospiraceae bacterium]